MSGQHLSRPSQKIVHNNIRTVSRENSMQLGNEAGRSIYEKRNPRLHVALRNCTLGKLPDQGNNPGRARLPHGVYKVTAHNICHPVTSAYELTDQCQSREHMAMLRNSHDGDMSAPRLPGVTRLGRCCDIGCLHIDGYIRD